MDPELGSAKYPGFNMTTTMEFQKTKFHETEFCLETEK